MSPVLVGAILYGLDMGEENETPESSFEPVSDLSDMDPTERTKFSERLGHIMFDGNRQSSNQSTRQGRGPSLTGSLRRWQVTEHSLTELGDTEAWRNSGIKRTLGFSPRDVYGPTGKIAFVWSQTWVSAEEMRVTLCTNMGGGVSIQVIDELVRLSRID